VAVAGGLTLAAGGVAAARDPAVSDAVMAPLEAAWDYVSARRDHRRGGAASPVLTFVLRKGP
jgi:hypothetical protein